MDNEFVEQKSNKGYIVVIVILSLLVVGLGGFVVYDKCIREDESKNIEEKKEDIIEEDISLDSELITDDMKKIPDILKSNGYTDYSGFVDYFFKNDKIILIEESSELRNTIAGLLIDTNDISDLKYDNPINEKYGKYYFLEDVLKAKYVSLFGNNYERPKSVVTQMYCGVPFSFSDENNRFEYEYSFGCGGTQCDGILTSFDSAKHIVKNNKDFIELYQLFAYGECEGGWYSDYDKKNLVVKSFDLIGSTESIILKNKDRLGMYKYTFEKNDVGNYLFVSVEKVR